MKILFVTKPFAIEPLGMMYLSAAAKRAGHQTSLALTSENLEEKIGDTKPDVVGYSVMTGDQQFYIDLNARLKQTHDFLSIFGGPHPTFFPEMVQEPGVDLVCRGEGEEALVELLETAQSGKDISTVHNFWIKTPRGIVKNEVRSLAQIDSIPFPDRELISGVPKIKDGPIKHFIASRGCPFSCSYCFNESFSQLYRGKGQRVRFRSIDSLIEEVQEVVQTSPTKFVYFQDDTFTLDKEWLKEFSQKYPAIGLPFHCHVRPNTIDEEKIKLLKDAGCYSVHIAAETADDRIRNEILRRGMTREQIIFASDLLKKAGIRFMLQNMIGLPTGSLEKDLETLELNIECAPDYAWVSIFQPYPGTRLGKYCKEQGFYTGDFADLAPNFFDSSRLRFSGEYKRQLANLQKIFAILVEHPELHTLGLSRIMMNAPDTPEVREAYKQAYQKFRKKGDKRLYGFELG